MEVGEGVYIPREDTELLVDNLDVKGNERVLEMGTGSGAVALLASRRAAHVIGVDVDPNAIASARKNAEINEARNVEFIESDLFARVRGKFDVIAFNAPYLPVSDPWEARAWSGGQTGREVLERFVQQLKPHLAPGGRVLVLISSLTGLEETKAMFQKQGFRAEVVAEKKVPWETLYCLRVVSAP